MNVKISVVIPLYNKEQSIIITLQSVLNQTCKDFELIIVNDGSTDNSAKVVKDYIDNVQTTINICLINKDNGGVSSARNCGIKQATGEYIAFLDGDDLWADTYIEELSKLINDFPGFSIYGIRCVEINDDDIPVIPQTDFFRGCVNWSYQYMCYSGSSTCVRREDAFIVGLFDERLTYGEDKDLWFRLQLLGGGACYHKPLAFYRQNSENRAMKRVIPLNKHLAFYIDKYANDRKNNRAFRAFFDAEIIYVLYPYLFDAVWKKDAKYLSKKIDYKNLKKSFWFRMHFPYLYALYLKFKSVEIL